MNEKKHLVRVEESTSGEVKEFYISEEVLNYLRKNMINKTPQSTTLPEINHDIKSDDIYIKHINNEILKLETEKEKLELKIEKEITRYLKLRSKYFEIVKSMKRYSKIEKYSNFIDLPQEEVDALINYRKAWILFKERRKKFLSEINIDKNRIALIDAGLEKYTNFLKGINS